MADPAPVVRAARARRRAQVALAGERWPWWPSRVCWAVARSSTTIRTAGGRRGVSLGDPYSAAACPDVLPESGPMPDLADVKAIRYCAAGLNGFPAQPGPPDALVYGIDDFGSILAATPDADPARCAAVDVIPSDSRLAYELADGSMVFTPVTMCTDVTVGDRTTDGAELGQSFFAALDSQRYVDDYVLEPLEIDLNCQTPTSSGPAQPGREQLIAVAICPADDPESLGGVLAAGSDDPVQKAWADGISLDPAETCEKFDPTPSLVALTDRGDVIRLEGSPCGYLLFYGWENDQPPYLIPFDATGLSASP